MNETLKQRVRRAVREKVEIVPYDPRWPDLFLRERAHLLSCLPQNLVGRIEHVGSTAVPGMAAKPIIDILVEVSSLEETKSKVVPILVSQGYDYFWRPTSGDGTPPFYAWFIKRDGLGARTHHIHMVEPHFEHWDWLLFRDHLISHPETAGEYRCLKIRLAAVHPHDRAAYSRGKSEFIARVTSRARELYA